MSGTTAVAPARQSFVVEWEEPEALGLDEAEEGSPEAHLVTVTSVAVRTAGSREREGDAFRIEADRLAAAGMQGEPSS